MTDLPPNTSNTSTRSEAGEIVRKLLPRRSAGLKLLLVCILALLMAIPALFVYGVVLERSSGAHAAFADVSQGVGGEQIILGPVLALPYSLAPDPNKPDNAIFGVAIAYPETGSVEASVTVENKARGIHLVPVFKADLQFVARIDPAALRNALPEDAAPIWSDARLYMGLSDNRGIKDRLDVVANGSPVLIEPLISSYYGDNRYNPVPHSDLSLAAGKINNLQNIRTPFDIRASMVVTGANRFAMSPFAKDTRMTMTSNWADPSFTGGTIPTSHNSGESEDGFTANWHLPYLARGIAGASARADLAPMSDYGSRDMAVRFITEAGPYQSVLRVLKYAAMFIGMVFLSYFLFEVTSGLRAHPAQYVLVGLAQSIFYLLLLAFSEFVGFDAAFIISAGMTILLISSYAIAVFKSQQYGLRALGILTGIYMLIYILLRTEGHALIAGALASFAAIGITMYLTRNVDWYGDRQPKST